VLPFLGVCRYIRKKADVEYKLLIENLIIKNLDYVVEFSIQKNEAIGMLIGVSLLLPKDGGTEKLFRNPSVESTPQVYIGGQSRKKGLSLKWPICAVFLCKI